MESMLVPTRLDMVHEVKGCTPNRTNGYACDNEWIIPNRSQNVYVADIERNTVMFTHSFKRREISGQSTDMEGRYQDCVQDQSSTNSSYPLEELHECPGQIETRPIACVSKGCQQERHVALLSQHVGLRGRRQHRTMSGGRVELDAGGEEVDSTYNEVRPADVIRSGVFATP